MWGRATEDAEKKERKKRKGGRKRLEAGGAQVRAGGEGPRRRQGRDPTNPYFELYTTNQCPNSLESEGFH